MTRPIIIGQAPSRRSDPTEPLSGNSGRRLAALCDLSMPEFLSTFERANLVEAFPGRSSAGGDLFVGRREARRLAERFRPLCRGRQVVVLGFSTAAAFGLTHPAMMFAPHWEGSFAFTPHPSGVSRWWNDGSNVRRARRFWRALVRGLDPERTPRPPSS